MEKMEALYERVCGRDVHKKRVVACRRRLTSSGRVVQAVCTFGTTTLQRRALVAWLTEWDVPHVALASPGGPWKPGGNIFAGPGELLRVNARPVQMVPGRTTDVQACAGIAQLLQEGLRRGSVVPTPPVRQGRDFTRQRRQLTGHRAAAVNRIHKVLEDANVKLSAVLRDIRGVSGRRMLQAIVAGETDAAVLSQLGDPKLRASQAVLQDSLHGRLTDHHRFMLAGL